MKSDAQLKSDVAAELAWDASIDPTQVGVAVDQGVVTLSGQVGSYLHKHAIEKAVRRVAGVRGIALDLEVRLETDHQRSDAAIAQAAVEMLQWHSLVPDGCVKVEVEDGYLTLTGEVEWPYQLASAEKCVRPLTGIMGVNNRITLKPRADAHAIREDIESAFSRHARRQASRVDVSVEGGIVTLRGTVDSLGEHDAALGTARAARGVTRVIDRLEIAA